MLLARRAGLVGKQAPQEITERAATAIAGEPPPRETTRAMTAVSHFTFGVLAGALFGLLATPRRLVIRIPWGVAYALVIWFVSYAGWAPALRLMPPPTEDDPGRQTTMIAAHLVYGTALAVLCGGAPTRLPRSAPT